MNVKSLLDELGRRLHKSFESVNESKEVNEKNELSPGSGRYATVTTKNTRLTDEATTAHVTEIATLASSHAADILAGK